MVSQPVEIAGAAVSTEIVRGLHEVRRHAREGRAVLRREANVRRRGRRHRARRAAPGVPPRRLMDPDRQRRSGDLPATTGPWTPPRRGHVGARTVHPVEVPDDGPRCRSWCAPGLHHRVHQLGCVPARGAPPRSARRRVVPPRYRSAGDARRPGAAKAQSRRAPAAAQRAEGRHVPRRTPATVAVRSRAVLVERSSPAGDAPGHDRVGAGEGALLGRLARPGAGATSSTSSASRSCSTSRSSVSPFRRCCRGRERTR